MNQENSAFLKEFTEKYKHHYSRTVSVVLKFVKDKTIAEDIASETITKLFEILDKGHPIDNINAFLLGMLKNRSLDHLKERKGFRENLKKYGPPMVAETGNPILYKLETKETLKIINAEIEKTPQGLKIVLLSRIDDIEYQEIAEELNISVKSANQYMWRARNKIRPNLEKMGIM
jgi:RNA polymerase sigma-70 factor (ECF subfamily)